MPRADNPREVLRIILDDVIAKTVEGVDDHRVSARSSELGQAPTHARDPALGEGEGEDLGRRGIGLPENVGNPQGEDLGFARPRPSHHHHRPLNRVHRLFLLRVKPLVGLKKFVLVLIICLFNRHPGIISRPR